jgi:hypothetical protein
LTVFFFLRVGTGFLAKPLFFFLDFAVAMAGVPPFPRKIYEFSLLREHNLLFFPRLSRIKIKFSGKINRLPPKNRRPVKKLFLPIGWWVANLQLSGGDYSERQKKVDIVCPAFLCKIPPTPLYKRGARGDFIGEFLKGAV